MPLSQDWEISWPLWKWKRQSLHKELRSQPSQHLMLSDLDQPEHSSRGSAQPVLIKLPPLLLRLALAETSRGDDGHQQEAAPGQRTHRGEVGCPSASQYQKHPCPRLAAVSPATLLRQVAPGPQALGAMWPGTQQAGQRPGSSEGGMGDRRRCRDSLQAAG